MLKFQSKSAKFLNVMIEIVAIFQDNPADFSYFFDSSRRRTCYIAPERFVSSAELASKAILPEEQLLSASQLTHSMDIFSVG